MEATKELMTGAQKSLYKVLLIQVVFVTLQPNY